MQDGRLDLAQAVLDALVRHFRHCRDSNIARRPDLYPKGYLIAYGTLGQQTGIDLDPRNVAGPLYDISQFCDLHNLKPVHSLVVRKEERSPGAGYFRAVGTEVASLDEGQQYQRWYEWAQSCIDSDDFTHEHRIVP